MGYLELRVQTWPGRPFAVASSFSFSPALFHRLTFRAKRLLGLLLVHFVLPRGHSSEDGRGGRRGARSEPEVARCRVVLLLLLELL